MFLLIGDYKERDGCLLFNRCFHRFSLVSGDHLSVLFVRSVESIQPSHQTIILCKRVMMPVMHDRTGPMQEFPSRMSINSVEGS